MATRSAAGQRGHTKIAWIDELYIVDILLRPGSDNAFGVARGWLSVFFPDIREIRLNGMSSFFYLVIRTAVRRFAFAPYRCVTAVAINATQTDLTAMDIF